MPPAQNKNEADRSRATKTGQIEELATPLRPVAERARGVMMSQPASRFSKAVAAHDAGQLNKAVMLYEATIASQPDHVDALHRLGLLFAQQCTVRPGCRSAGACQRWCAQPRGPAAALRCGAPGARTPPGSADCVRQSGCDCVGRPRSPLQPRNGIDCAAPGCRGNSGVPSGACVSVGLCRGASADRHFVAG